MTVDLAKQAAQKMLDGLREGYELARKYHEANPDPASEARLDDLWKKMGALERHVAGLPVLPQVSTRPQLAQARPVAPANSVQDAADRAERRSAEMRAKGRSAL